MTELVLNEETCRRVLGDLVPAARRLVWIATADLKDLHFGGESGRRGRSRPFIETLASLVERGVEVRLVHAKEPGPRFRADFDKCPALIESELFDRVLCPRMHMKCVVVDAVRAYIGSANLTGAGMGAKGPHRRNFEAGVVTDDPTLVVPLMQFLDRFHLGECCLPCQRRQFCPDPIV